MCGLKKCLIKDYFLMMLTSFLRSYDTQATTYFNVLTPTAVTV